MHQAAHCTFTYSRDVIDVRFLYHGAHRMLNRPVGKLIVGVLFPDRLQVEIRTAHLWFQELQIPRVRH